MQQSRVDFNHSKNESTAQPSSKVETSEQAHSQTSNQKSETSYQSESNQNIDSYSSSQNRHGLEVIRQSYDSNM